MVPMPIEKNADAGRRNLSDDGRCSRTRHFHPRAAKPSEDHDRIQNQIDDGPAICENILSSVFPVDCNKRSQVICKKQPMDKTATIRV